ncbi:CvpA family protein [Chloroflexota bacterium]
MSWLDIIIIIVLAVFTLMGLKTGIIKAVLSLAGMIIGVILAGHYYLPLSEQLPFVSQTGVARIVAFAIILIGTMVIASVLARLLKRATSAIMLGWVNRLGGAIFGLVLAAIFCGAALAIWIKLFGIAGAITESSLAIILLDRLPLALALLPNEFDSTRSFFY